MISIPKDSLSTCICALTIAFQLCNVIIVQQNDWLLIPKRSWCGDLHDIEVCLWMACWRCTSHTTLYNVSNRTLLGHILLL